MERSAWMDVLRTVAESVRRREVPAGIDLERSFMMPPRHVVRFARGSAQMNVITGDSIESAVQAAILRPPFDDLAVTLR